MNALLKLVFILVLMPSLMLPSIQQKGVKDEATAGKQETKLSEEQEQALMTVKQVAVSAGSLGDRLRGSLLEAQAADLLWPFDEIQARFSFQQALESVTKVQPPHNAPESDQQKFLRKIQQAKDEILRLLSRHDAKVAEELAKAVKQDAKETPEASSKGQPETAESLVQMGRGVVKDDPKKALEFGLKSIQSGQFAQEFGVLFAELYMRDREAGQRLLLGSVDQLTKPGADVLSGLAQLSPLAATPQIWEREPVFREVSLRLLEIFSQKLTETVLLIRQGQLIPREAANALIRVAQERFIPALQVIDSSRLPEVQQLLSELTTQLEARYQKLSALRPIVAGQYENFESELVKAEGERDAAVRDIWLRGLAVGALKRKEYENARRAAEKIQEVDLRLETRDDVNLGQATNETGKQNFSEAARLAQDIGDLLLRTKALTWIATRTIKDELFARQLLEGAYASAEQAENTAGKAQALVTLADTYTPLDVPRASQIYFAAAQIMNKLVPSAATDEHRPKKRSATIEYMVGAADDLVLAKEQITLADIAFGRGLERLGQEDYQQAMLLANSLKHDILRARMQLAVCRGVLGKKPTDQEARKK